MHTQVVIYLSRWKMSLTALGALLFVLAAIPFWREGRAEGGVTACFVALIAGMDVLFFGMCLLYALYRLIRTTPALVLNAQGFYDNASVVGAGFVAWEEVASVHVGQRCVGIVPRDIEAFLRRQPAWRRELMRAGIGLAGVPITIPTSALPMSPEELQAQMVALRIALEQNEREQDD